MAWFVHNAQSMPNPSRGRNPKIPQYPGSQDDAAPAANPQSSPKTQATQSFLHFLVAIVSQYIHVASVNRKLATEPETERAMTLNQARVGCDLRIQVLQGPGCERLRDLGFCEQMPVRKLTGGRNLLCSVCGTRMAISKELAEQVLVKLALGEG